ncbi:MAG: T9SS type A sorting domain-containing protein [Bacteroidales bacterium]
MKRTIFITCLAIFFVNVSSQNFECIKTDAVYYFTDVDLSFTGEHQYKAIRIDSTAINSDTTTYFQFPVIGIENWQWDCYSGNWPSWIGKNIDVKADGTTIFYNLENAPVTIKPQMDTGTEWYCLTFYTGSIIKAHVVSIEEMTFLGITEMVKKIGFQAYNGMGEPMIHPVNYMYLLVSQNHGLIRSINFKVFPDLIDNFWGDECHEYEICGISEPEIGIQNLTIDRIYDFEVGDEFHIYEYSWEGTSANNFKYIKTVIGKEVINDEITYTYSRCGRKQIYENVPNFDTVLLIQDTIMETILPYYPGHEALNQLPDQYLSSGDTTYLEYAWGRQFLEAEYNKTGKLLVEGYFSYYPHDCIEEFITGESIFWDEYYYEGLGGPYWDQTVYWSSKRDLVYYKKDNETWGEPYNCDSLLVSQSEISLDELSITIAPNPMKDYTRITIYNPGQQKTTIALYTIMGQIAKEERSTEMEIKKGEIQPGIYLIRVFESDRLVGTKKLVVE